MKHILTSVSLILVGLVGGYFGRQFIAEDRMQKNLMSLSGESLSHLDDLGRYTRGYSPDQIDRLRKDFEDYHADMNDIIALQEAAKAWQSAITFQQVERVGWDRYRSLIIGNCGRFLNSRGHGAFNATSGPAKKAVKSAEEMIHEAIPAELLADRRFLY